MTLVKTKLPLILTCLGLQAIPLSTIAATHTIDVLGVYPNHVSELVADPRALFVNNIEYANKALQNSGANYRYNLVHVEQRNWSNDEGISSANLENLKDNDGIEGLRESYGADLVAALVTSSNGYCGYGYLPSGDTDTHTFKSWAKDYGYSISGYDCGGRTMAHEMGHTMGLGHSPAQGSSGTLAEWGRGWGVDGSFATIMAYASSYGVRSSEGRLQIHSNPALYKCDGKPCGKEIGTANASNAVRALNLAAPQIAQWQTEVTAVDQNQAPVATNDYASTDANTSVSINVLQNDSDPDDDALYLSNVGTASNGQTQIPTGQNRIVYTPTAGFSGNDSFTYKIRDGRGATDTATVSVRVDPSLPPANDGNLIINGNAEGGLAGWTGLWGTSLSVIENAHSGTKSIRGREGSGIQVKIKTPLDGNKYVESSGWLRATETNKAYAYIYLKQDGNWSYRYLSTVNLNPGQWTRFQRERYIPGSSVSEAYVLFHFPGKIRGSVAFDDIELTLD